MNRLSRINRWLLEMAQTINEAVRRGVRAARKVARSHVDQMLHDPGYAAAFRDLAIAAVDVFVPTALARYVADQVLTIYLAVLRLLRPPRGGLGPLWA